MNKRKRILLLLLVMIMVVLSPADVFAERSPERTIKIWINDFYVMSDVYPFLEENRTYVPLRFIAEELGYQVVWDGANRQVIVSQDNTTMNLIIDSNIVFVNGDTLMLDAPARIRHGRTFVPLRAIAELFGEAISFDPDTKIAAIGEDFDSSEYYPIKYYLESKDPFITNFRVNFDTYHVRYSDGRIVELNSDQDILKLIDVEAEQYQEPDFVSVVPEDKQLYDRLYIAPLEDDPFVGSWHGITSTAGTSDYYDVYAYVERESDGRYLFTRRSIKDNGSELITHAYGRYDSERGVMQTERSHSTSYASGDFSRSWFTNSSTYIVKDFDFLQDAEDDKRYLRKY
ncbi:copper amine oxidase N-terminal domain-containing protein [Tindallia californiensis]|uniref:Copper amine oxidase N-terminal domain-containing protein n=1 Tax=Tindallia californiensis TaxID=159292 RepID=A0A1H3PAH6_9FIRM|nr:copper amine oxidase N-terminal domain-containing protein [Tindallia californiensis]SDY98097.1 Copper amine oxidase N-terminal domain-containing protein [Tindallia californiensis]